MAKDDDELRESKDSLFIIAAIQGNIGQVVVVDLYSAETQQIDNVFLVIEIISVGDLF